MCLPYTDVNRVRLHQQAARILIAAMLFLVGCRSGEEAATTTSSPTLPSPQHETSASTVQPTFAIQSSSSPTEAGSTATLESAYPICNKYIYSSLGTGNVATPSLPDLSALHWETLKISGNTIRQYRGLGYPVIHLDPSPNGRWLATVLDTAGRRGIGTVVVIDTQDDVHWWANTNAYLPVDYPSQVWLPDNRLLWINEDKRVFVGNGQNRHDLKAPKPMIDIRYASHGIALATDQNYDLWRVNVNSNTWERVTTTEPLGENSNLGGSWSYGIAPDGSYALDFVPPRLWRIPIRMGAAAEPTAKISQSLDFVGTDVPFPPAVKLADSPYTLFGWHLTGQEGVVVNEIDGHFLTTSDLEVPEAYQGYSYRSSPDGRWLVVTVEDPQRAASRAEYIAPTNDLTAGRIIEGVSVVSWHDTPPAVIFCNRATGVLSIAPLPLAASDSGQVLSGAMPPLVMLPDALIAIDSSAPARILQFDLTGKVLTTLDLSAYYSSITAGASKDGRVYLGALSTDNRDAALVEWIPKP